MTMPSSANGTRPTSALLAAHDPARIDMGGAARPAGLPDGAQRVIDLDAAERPVDVDAVERCGRRSALKVLANQ
jgi:hypothetical protein